MNYEILRRNLVWDLRPEVKVNELLWKCHVGAEKKQELVQGRLGRDGATEEHTAPGARTD